MIYIYLAIGIIWMEKMIKLDDNFILMESYSISLNNVRGIYLATLFNNNTPVQTIKLVLF